MPYAQAMAWFEYLEIEGPLGELRDDMRAGVVASWVFNMGRGERTPARVPSDFFPFLSSAEKESSKMVDKNAAPLKPMNLNQLAAFKAAMIEQAKLRPRVKPESVTVV